MRHIGLQYISDLAVCDRPDQAADHSLSLQFWLKVLQRLTVFSSARFPLWYAFSKKGFW
jgi:hypothetical protein